VGGIVLLGGRALFQKPTIKIILMKTAGHFRQDQSRGMGWLWSVGSIKS